MAKYDYKIARTAVYTVLFGKQEHTYIDKKVRSRKRSNVPEADETRQLSHFWEPNAAQLVFVALIADCKFSAERVEFLKHRLETLRQRYKRKQQAETAH